MEPPVASVWAKNDFWEVKIEICSTFGLFTRVLGRNGFLKVFLGQIYTAATIATCFWILERNRAVPKMIEGAEKYFFGRVVIVFRSQLSCFAYNHVLLNAQPCTNYAHNAR